MLKDNRNRIDQRHRAGDSQGAKLGAKLGTTGMDKVVAFDRSQSLDDFIPAAPKRIAAERDRRTK